MNKLFFSFSVKKLSFIIFLVLSLPLVLTTCLIYGILVGIIGSIVDSFEETRKAVYREMIDYLKYPERTREKFKQTYLNSIEDKNLRDQIEEDFRLGKRKPPKMWGLIFSQIFFAMAFFPLLFCWAVLTGPIRAFLEYYKWAQRILITKEQLYE